MTTGIETRGPGDRPGPPPVAVPEAVPLAVPVAPDGAFYVWADCRAHADDSWEFSMRMMKNAHVALTPGKDFGPTHAAAFVRLSFATGQTQLEETVRRLARELRP